MQRHLLSKGSLTVALLAGVAVTHPAPAQAYDTGAVYCPAAPTTCVNSFYHQVYGTVKVRADIAGPSTTKIRWVLYRPDGTPQCYGDVVPKEAAKTWYCTGVAVGQHQIRMYTTIVPAWTAASY